MKSGESICVDIPGMGKTEVSLPPREISPHPDTAEHRLRGLRLLAAGDQVHGQDRHHQGDHLGRLPDR